MNTIKLNTLGDKVIVRKAAENGGNAGGDTGGSGGGSSLEYLEVELSKNDIHEGWSNLLIFNPCLIKAEIGGGYGLQIGTFGFIQQYAEEYNVSIKAIMLNMDAVITVPDIGTLNFEQVLESIGMADTIASLPRITEEQFYTL